jgi:hypothetical protein
MVEARKPARMPDHPAHMGTESVAASARALRWVALRNPSYLLPIKVLARRFRTLLCQALRLAARKGELQRVPADVLPHITIEGAAAQEWIAYAKRPFGGPEQVLAYLSQYTHRVAISNHRIVAFERQKVTFRWRDYADGNRAKLCTLDALEFVRRFLLHVLPDRFVRIRYFGFLANRNRSDNIKRARALIGCATPARFPARYEPLVLCSICRGQAAMSADPLQHHRSPPIRFNAA